MSEMRDEKYVNWLYHVPGIGRKTLHVMLTGARENQMELSDFLCQPEHHMKLFLEEKCSFSEKVADRIAENIGKTKKSSTADLLWEEMKIRGIRFLMPENPEFPQRLKQIPDAPVGLYVKGNGDFLDEKVQKKPVVAVIGSRICSEYGKYVARQIGEACAEYGVSLVSGMALGIDGVSQWSCVKKGGRVAAVLGCGADICYPPANRPLYDELSLRGCICSEYVPGTEPKANYFPPRNRIISGMADVLVVVEAKEKSGTLITVDMALEQGKEVYAVPGRVTDPMSAGCNRLIHQGATVVCAPVSVVEEIANTGLHNLGIDRSNKATQSTGETFVKNPYPPESEKYCIYEVLDMNPLSVQQIYEKLANKTEIDISRLQREILYMQMDGAVQETGGRFFVL